MMVVKSDLEIQYIGGVLNDKSLRREMELIKEQISLRKDHLEGFKVVDRNISAREKKEFISFLKKMEETFAENLSFFLSWKLEFSEQVTYSLSGEAVRHYSCDLKVMLLEENEGYGDNLADMVR